MGQDKRCFPDAGVGGHPAISWKISGETGYDGMVSIETFNPDYWGKDPRVGNNQYGLPDDQRGSGAKRLYLIHKAYLSCRPAEGAWADENPMKKLRRVRYVTYIIYHHAGRGHRDSDRADPEIQNAPGYDAVYPRRIHRSGIRQNR